MPRVVGYLTARERDPRQATETRHWTLETRMSFSLDTALAVWRRTPATLDALLRDLPEPLLHATEGPDTFSPIDVMGHLIEGEETDWMARARIILAQGNDRRFAPFDRFRHRERAPVQGVGPLLDEFSRLRTANLAELLAWQLQPSQMSLTGIHPKFGTVTLEQLLATWMVHDLGHIAQVVRVIAKQQRDEVGPWIAFLPVLTDRPVPAS
jgi:hypothetical protein